MKIVYLIDWDVDNNNSVLQKIAQTIRIWEKYDHDVTLVMISRPVTSEFIHQIKKMKVFERKKLYYLFFDSFKTFVGKTQCFNDAYLYIKEIDPDIIYYRPMMWYPTISKCISIASVFFEINSIDEEEIKLVYHPKSLTYFIYFYGRRALLKKASGIITLTKEIKRYLSFCNKPAIVIGNGISIDRNSIINHNNLNERTQIVFVGTPGQPWQGFEKFNLLATFLPEFDFHLVGPDSIDTNPIAENMIVHGFLNAIDLKKLYETMDIGVGTLSLYKKNMSEACPLKVREYVAFGLPVIVGYEDTDLDNQRFILNIGCYDNNVIDHIQEIKEFIIKWKGKYIDINEVEQLVGSLEKEKTRLNFIQKWRKPVI